MKKNKEAKMAKINFMSVFVGAAISRFKSVGWAFVVVATIGKPKRLHQACGPVSEELSSMGNGIGEMKAVMEAVKYAVSEKVKVLHIMYEYAGTREWAIGGWKVRTKYTQAYQSYVCGMAKKAKMRIIWEKRYGENLAIPLSRCGARGASIGDENPRKVEVPAAAESLNSAEL